LRQSKYVQNSLRALDMELNLMQEGGFLEAETDSGEGLFTVLLWKLDGKITQEEFSEIYAEWCKARAITDAKLTRSGLSP
jgi:hypothetical protein